MLLAIAIVSSIVAVVTSVVAWRASRDERARSRARVEALARAIDGDTAEVFDLKLRVPDSVPTSRGDAAPPVRSAPVLSAPEPGGVGSRLGLSLAAGAFVVTTAAAIAIVFSSESPTASANPAVATHPAAVDRVGVSLELLSLDQERDADRLIVRGVVRNPSGVEMEQLAAIVTAVAPDGTARAMVRSALDSQMLAPGAQSTFSVTVPEAGGVGRYRVSFRWGDRAIPHVDKRSGS